MLEVITKIENELEKKNVYQRVVARISNERGDKLRLLQYRPTFKKPFKNLNREWLTEYFEVESEDERILSDPQRHIINPGGSIFFAEHEGEIVGTTALVKHNQRVYEIAKMAVTKKHRGQHIGERLARAAIEKAAELGAREVMLVTSLKLKAANELYRKLGFVEIEKPSFYVQKLKRPSIYMKLKIKE